MTPASETADREIRALLPGWLDAVRRKDSVAIAGFYAPDGRFMVPNAPAAEGRAAVAALWEHLLALPGAALTFGPTSIEAAASGDLALRDRHLRPRLRPRRRRAGGGPRQIRRGVEAAGRHLEGRRRYPQQRPAGRVGALSFPADGR